MKFKNLKESEHKNPYTKQDKEIVEKLIKKVEGKEKETLQKILKHINDELLYGI